MPAGTSELRFWIDSILECNRRDHTPSHGPGDQRGPFLSARALGMATAALQCAYEGNGPDAVYQVQAMLPPPAGSDAALRAAAACHQLLVRRYPNQARILYPLWDTWLNLYRDGTTSPAEEAWGRSLAHRIHNHANTYVDPDGKSGYSDQAIARIEPYSAKGRGDHDQPPAEPNQGFAGTGWGKATPLKATRVATFAPPPGRSKTSPFAFDGTDAEYLKDLALVRDKGGFQTGGRTGREEVVGVYWGYDGPPELGTPPRLYMQVALEVLDQFHARQPMLSPSDELKAIAGVGIAIADAGIDAWHYKYSPMHLLWRPTIGIPHHGDMDWLPYGRPDTNGTGVGLTPNFPAYPSGHATFGAAAFQVLRLFLVEKKLARFRPNGTDTVRFTFTSDEYNGRNTCPRTGLPRPNIALTYDSLWAAITDNSVSRVFLGVHWQFDGITRRPAGGGDGVLGVPAAPAQLGNRGGVWLGAQIANQIAPLIGVSPATITASRIDAPAPATPPSMVSP